MQKYALVISDIRMVWESNSGLLSEPPITSFVRPLAGKNIAGKNRFLVFVPNVVRSDWVSSTVQKRYFVNFDRYLITIRPTYCVVEDERNPQTILHGIVTIWTLNSIG